MEALRSSQEGGKFEFVPENFALVKVKVLSKKKQNAL